MNRKNIVYPNSSGGKRLSRHSIRVFCCLAFSLAVISLSGISPALSAEPGGQSAPGRDAEGGINMGVRDGKPFINTAPAPGGNTMSTPEPKAQQQNNDAYPLLIQPEIALPWTGNTVSGGQGGWNPSNQPSSPGMRPPYPGNRPPHGWGPPPSGEQPTPPAWGAPGNRPPYPGHRPPHGWGPPPSGGQPTPPAWGAPGNRPPYPRDRHPQPEHRPSRPGEPPFRPR